jgi:succinyl-CoA synthetase beta subunit
MNIHEYQAKQVLAKFGVPVPVGIPALSIEEAVKAAEKLLSDGAFLLVLKAQIHAGGRGKAGGVKLCKTVADVEREAKIMMGKTLVTHQTGPEGKVVKRLYVESGSNIEKEYYLSAVVDRATSSVVFVASSEGGMDIEEVAHNSPEKITKVGVLIGTGVQGFHIRVIAAALGVSGKTEMASLTQVIKGIYDAVIATDASQVEINPLIKLEDGTFKALDAKVNFDDNALFRHPEIVALRDLGEEEPSEIEASKHGLSYVKMNGSIGCMVNGAGLAMATMDIIKHYGQEPANFLDVGGGATKEKVTEAFKIILSDSSVKAILVNIFGGIMKCDIIAEGVIAAAKELGVKVPLVVRLEGTNVELGKQILANSGLAIIPADNLEDAAQKVTKAVANLS